MKYRTTDLAITSFTTSNRRYNPIVLSGLRCYRNSRSALISSLYFFSLFLGPVSNVPGPNYGN